MVAAQLALLLRHRQAWMKNNAEPMVRKVVDLSVEHSVVCAHTVMVAFETTPDRYDALMQQVRQ